MKEETTQMPGLDLYAKFCLFPNYMCDSCKENVQLLNSSTTLFLRVEEQLMASKLEFLAFLQNRF